MKALISSLNSPPKTNYRLYLAISSPPGTSPYSLSLPADPSPHTYRLSIWLQSTSSPTAGIELEPRRSKAGRGPWAIVTRSRSNLHDSIIIGLILIGRLGSHEALEGVAARLRRDVARPPYEERDAGVWVRDVLEYVAGKGWARDYDWVSLERLMDGLVEEWTGLRAQGTQQIHAGAVSMKRPRVVPVVVKERVGTFRYRWRVTGSVAED